ncbi:MAG: rhomboid family intramembrane serine protease [Myxococcota bacterium]
MEEGEEPATIDAPAAAPIGGADDAVGVAAGDVADEVGNEAAGDAANGPGTHRRIRLVQGGAILLEPDGFRLIESRGMKRSPLHPYESITHVYSADRALLIGTPKGLLAVRESDFPEPDEGPEEARRLLLERLAGRPDGADSLSRMERVEALGDRNHRPYAIWGAVLLCLLGTAFQIRDPLLEKIGAFMPDLFLRGELWRGMTAHFLHGLPAPGLFGFFPSLPGLPVHLAVNVGGMLVLGHLVERPLGSWRTVLVLMGSGLGTLIGIMMKGHVEVIGASGLVSGLAGAMLALELHFPAALPCYWRLPRRLFIGVILLQFVIIDPFFWRFLAGGAHLGGFAGGYVAAWWLGSPSVEGLSATPRMRIGTYVSLVLVAFGLTSIIPLARREMPALERHAARLLNTPSAYHLYEHDNAAAWFISIGEEPTPYGLELAVALADRAVEMTGQLQAGILDTLAEALFQSGDRLGALITIDQAIRLRPDIPYFIEQRRRFSGERDPDDRPADPGTGEQGAPSFESPDDVIPIDPSAPRITV